MAFVRDRESYTTPAAVVNYGKNQMNELQMKILEVIKLNNGKFSWYQLDRALSESGIAHAGNLMEILREFVASGKISTTDGANPSQPAYSITEIGESFLSESD